MTALWLPEVQIYEVGRGQVMTPTTQQVPSLRSENRRQCRCGKRIRRFATYCGAVACRPVVTKIITRELCGCVTERHPMADGAARILCPVHEEAQ